WLPPRIDLPSLYTCNNAKQRRIVPKTFCIFVGSTMDHSWDDIRLFLAVARAESLSAAGRLVRLDPATLGRRIARLEEVLAAKLFAKSPQGYALTDAGQRLLAHAERAEQAMAGAAEEIAGQSGRLTGQIRIGAPDGCANYLLPQVCAQI